MKIDSRVAGLFSLPSKKARRWFRQNRDEASTVLDTVEKLLRNRHFAMCEDQRLDAIDVMTAAIPLSVPHMRRLLMGSSQPFLLEVHFTLFVLLGWMRPPRDHALRRKLQLLGKAYLERVKPRARTAGLLAADFILRWNKAEGERILRNVEKRGTSSVGRKWPPQNFRIIPEIEHENLLL